MTIGALHLRLTVWVLLYYGSTAIAVSLGVLLLFRGRGPARLSFLALIAGASVTLLGTGTVFAAADVATATRLVRWAQGLVMWVVPCAIEFGHAWSGWPARRVRRALWIAAPLFATLSIATPWVIGSSRPYPYGFSG